MACGMPHGFYESGFGELSEMDAMYLGEEVLKLIKDGSVARSSNECLEFVAEHF